jgi:Holliday junction resolvasome RuvABC endonuclease subunit
VFLGMAAVVEADAADALAVALTHVQRVRLPAPLVAASPAASPRPARRR